MPGLFGGSKPAGTTTTVQTNPTQEAQLPFLERGWGQAGILFDQFRPTDVNNPWAPGSTIASAGWPWVEQGNRGLYNTGQAINQTLLPQANQFWQTGGQGSIYNSPAYNYFQNLAQGTTGPQGTFAGAADQAARYGAAAAGGNLGLSTLGNIAQGQYLNANPYTAQMVQNAMDPVIRNFQTAVAPQVDASFETAGRYGSGAARGAQETAQDTLGRTLGAISSNLYGTQFANERALQNQAAANYGQIYNQGQGIGITGASAAADAAYRNLLGQQAGATGLQGGYQSGINAALQASQQYPQLAASQFIGPQSAINAGTGFNAMQQPFLDEQHTVLQRYLGEIGQPTTGSSSTTSPYFQNQLANILGGAAGTLGIASGINNLTGGGITSGLNSLFGSSLPAASLIPGAALNAGNLFGAGSAIAASAAAPLSAATPVAVSELAPMVAALFASDRRLKKEDGVIGHLANGLPIHTFKYLWDSPHESPRVGLMADEVAQVHPDAVHRGPFGFAMVDYGRATT